MFNAPETPGQLICDDYAIIRRQRAFRNGLKRKVEQSGEGNNRVDGLSGGDRCGDPGKPQDKE